VVPPDPILEPALVEPPVEPLEATEPEPEPEPPLSDPLEAPVPEARELPDVAPEPVLESPLLEPSPVFVALCAPPEPTEPEPLPSDPPEEPPEDLLPEPLDVAPGLDAKANPSVEWPQLANIKAVHAVAPARRLCFLFRATIIQPL